MDPQIIYFLKTHFTNLGAFEKFEKFGISDTKTSTQYIRGDIHGDRYTISCHELYIIAKRVDEKDLYLDVCVNAQQVITLLNKIKNQENIVPSEKANILSSAMRDNII